VHLVGFQCKNHNETVTVYTHIAVSHETAHRKSVIKRRRHHVSHWVSALTDALLLVFRGENLSWLFESPDYEVTRLSTKYILLAVVQGHYFIWQAAPLLNQIVLRDG